MLYDIKNLIIFLLLMYVLHTLFGVFNKWINKKQHVDVAVESLLLIERINTLLVQTVEDYKIDYEKYEKNSFTIEQAMHMFILIRNSVQNSEYISEDDKNTCFCILDMIENSLSIKQFKEVVYCIVYNKGNNYDKEVIE